MMPARRRDFLQEVIGEFSSDDREFPALVQAALERRRLARELANKRTRLGITQTELAAAMGTSQSAVARIESGADTRMSTIERYTACLGQRLQWRLGSAARPKR